MASPTPSRHSPSKYVIAGIAILIVLVLVYINFTQQISIQAMEHQVIELTKSNQVLEKQNQKLQTDLDNALAQLRKKAEEKLNANYYPVQFNTFSNQYQKIAQTFQIDGTKTSNTIELTASYAVGNDINLSIYRWVENTPFESGTLLLKTHFPSSSIPANETFWVTFPQPITLTPNTYVMIFSAGDEVSQTSLKFSKGNPDPNGQMYIFTRIIGANGEILDAVHSWQIQANADLVYEFR